MLMSGSGRVARVQYLDGTFRLISDGDHVLCAVTGRRIALEELRYWSVARQEAYADAVASARAMMRAIDNGDIPSIRSMAARMHADLETKVAAPAVQATARTGT